MSSGRDVPAVYLTSVFLWFFSVLVFHRISKLRRISPSWEFDSHPGHHFFTKLTADWAAE
jgi:hypothetical protein